MFQVKRTYDAASESDGHRILVDRLWLRGIKKKDLAFDKWVKDVAPSIALRKWFDHREDRWDDFQQKYREELDQHAAWQPIFNAGLSDTVTLLYSARDTEHNHALVLQNYLTEHVEI